MRKLLYITFFLFLVQIGSAQEQSESRELNGRIVDFVTNDPMPDSTNVSLLSKDSILVVEGSVYNWFDGIKKVTNFSVSVAKPGDYILRVTNPHYYTEYKPVSVKFYKRENSINVGVVPMRMNRVHKEYELGELVVKGTLLKFYFSKDTLVYNAEAFLTQKGFLLNDILKKMPGLEIHDNGDIYSNGRKVDALLLNGKDFFNRDRKTLLENMPAYVVKQIKIYDKTRDTLSLIKREREFQGFVMDVKLKAEHSSSSIANVDVGYGTNRRYYAKAVGLKFSSVHRVSIYGFANNLNRTEMPNGNGDSYGMTNSNGEYIIDRAGLSYNFDNPRGLFSTEGDLSVSYIDGFSEIKNIRQNFFNSGDVFSRSYNITNQYNFSVSTSHKLNFLGNTPFDFTVRPSLKYSSVRRNSSVNNASFNTDVDGIWADAWVDSLMSYEPTDVMKVYGINHDVMKQKNNGDTFELQMDVEKCWDIPHTEDELHLSGSFVFSSDKNKEYKQRNIDYLKTSTNQFLNEYVENSTITREWKGNAVYVLELNNNHFFNLGYHYKYLSLDNTNPIYSLHKLAGWDHLNGNEIGLLPSERQMLNVLDKNSHTYWQRDNEHVVNLKYNMDIQPGQYEKINFSIDVPMNIFRRKMNYLRADCDTLVARNMIVPNINMNFSFDYSNYEKQNAFFFGVEYSLTHEMPSLYNLLNITNDNNPLYVTHGNSNLKNMLRHYFFTQFFYQTSKRNVHRLNFTFDKNDHQVSVAQMYHKETGITHATPINVNGNYSYDVKFVNNIYIDRTRRVQFTNTIQYNGNRSVDQIMSDDEGVTDMSTVRNRQVNEIFGLSFTSKNTKYIIKSQSFFQYNRATGDRANFVTQYYYNYGVTINSHFEMPWNLRLDTDWTLLARRGLTYSELNTTDYLWNASLTKAVSEKISFRFEAYDILRQRKLVVRRVNAQCSEEVFYNAMRSYMMFHCIIRLNASRNNSKQHTGHEHVESIL